jgi:hypothetical protein
MFSGKEDAEEAAVGMVPALRMARVFAPSRGVRRLESRSQVMRGRSSANSSEGYLPASMSRTFSKVERVSVVKGAARRAML